MSPVRLAQTYRFSRFRPSAKSARGCPPQGCRARATARAPAPPTPASGPAGPPSPSARTRSRRRTAATHASPSGGSGPCLSVATRHQAGQSRSLGLHQIADPHRRRNRECGRPRQRPRLSSGWRHPEDQSRSATPGDGPISRLAPSREVYFEIYFPNKVKIGETVPAQHSVAHLADVAGALSPSKPDRRSPPPAPPPAPSGSAPTRPSAPPRCRRPPPGSPRDARASPACVSPRCSRQTLTGLSPASSRSTTAAGASSPAAPAWPATAPAASATSRTRSPPAALEVLPAGHRTPSRPCAPAVRLKSRSPIQSCVPSGWRSPGSDRRAS